jgi:hypothetical protein
MDNAPREIEGAEVIRQRKIGSSWKLIAEEVFYVTPRKLFEWRKQNEFIEPRVIPSDEMLRTAVLHIKRRQPLIGDTILMAQLTHPDYYNFHVLRQRLRDLLAVIDPVGRELRRRRLTYRRQYPLVRSMWCVHMDGHHKLDFVKLCIHGLIDGFSRKVLFLWCSNNNSAHTVLDLYYETALVYGLPEKLYTDHGGENNGAGRFQAAVREHVDAWKKGKSTHNVRIERFWGDMHAKCICYYCILFARYEQENNINCRHVPVHQFVIHFLFIPLINENLCECRDSWNNHKMRTCRNKTPNQMFDRSENQALPIDPADERIAQIRADLSHDYGQKSITAFPCPLTHQEYAQFVQEILPLKMRDDEAVYLPRIFSAFDVCQRMFQARPLGLFPLFPF